MIELGNFQEDSSVSVFKVACPLQENYSGTSTEATSEEAEFS
jgi:hypothetical protein